MTDTTTTCTALEIAARLGDDGLAYEHDGSTLDSLCEAEDHDRQNYGLVVHWIFDDGSVIEDCGDHWAAHKPNAPTWMIEAYRLHDAGLREDVGTPETLGDTHGRVYWDRSLAESDADELRGTWELEWGLGACPTYVVEASA